MKGGFLDNLSTTLSGWGSSISQGASGLWQKTKSATSSLTGSTPTTTTSYPTSTQASSTPSGIMGGRTRRRRIRGGFKDNTPTTGLATHAAPFSGKTAQPHNMVGGKTRRRKHRHTKSCKHRR
jgi:hypothetical protein